MDPQSESAKNNTWMSQGLIDQMLIAKGKYGVCMEKK
jgi:hypothetical protein